MLWGIQIVMYVEIYDLNRLSKNFPLGIYICKSLIEVDVVHNFSNQNYIEIIYLTSHK